MSLLIGFKAKQELFRGIDYLVKQLYIGLSLTFLIVTFFPNNYYGSFAIGGHYNLGGPKGYEIMPFIITTIDSPFLSSLVLIFSTIIIINFSKIKKTWRLHKSKTIIIIMFLLSLIELLLINRRGPIIATLLTIITVLLMKKIKLEKLLFIFPIILIAPLYWEVIGQWLYAILSSDLFSSIIFKTDKMNIETATGRIYNWNIVLNHINNFNFNVDYLFGVGQLQELEDLGEYGHAHNSLFELLIKVGLVGTIIIYVLFFRSIRQLYLLVKINNNISLYLLFSISLYYMFLSIGESLLIAGYFSHLLFIGLIVIIDQIYNFNIQNKYQSYKIN